MRDRYIATYTTDGIRGFIPTVGEPGKGLEKLRNAHGEFIRHPSAEAAELYAARVLIGRLNGSRGAQTVIVRPRPMPPAPIGEAVASRLEPKQGQRRRIVVETSRARAARELDEVFGRRR